MAHRRIDAIDSGVAGGRLFICGVAALENGELLADVGARSILNCARRELYDHCRGGGTLWERLDGYRIQVLGAEDHDEQDLGAALDTAAEFIEEGAQSGGVIVHCAAGISRASNICIGFLMLRRGLSLSAAFCCVFRARPEIRPFDDIFWQQLCGLEKQLVARGIALSAVGTEVLDAAEAHVLRQRLDGAIAALEGGAAPRRRLVATGSPCTTEHAQAVQAAMYAGTVFEQVELDGEALRVRASLSEATTREDLCAVLSKLCGDGARMEIEVEREGPRLLPGKRAEGSERDRACFRA